MNQTTLLPYEKSILDELYKYNYSNSGVVCDVVLADKLKEVEGEWKQKKI